MPSCCSRGLLPKHDGDVPPPIDLPQPDLPARDEAEEQYSAASSFGTEPGVFTRRRNSSCSRSIVFVVLSVFHCAFGKVKNVRSSTVARESPGHSNSLLSSQRHPLMRSPQPDATTVGLSARCTRQVTLPAGRQAGEAPATLLR